MGHLLAIARAPVKRGPLMALEEAVVGVADGVDGDARGKRPGRQVTVVFREGWNAACRELGAELPWTTRRANLFVEGVAVPREGKRLVIGSLVLEVTQETQPCHVMEAAHRGLRAALTPDWRGGVCCRVIAGGTIRVGDRVDVEMSDIRPRDVLDFWFKDTPSEKWFSPDPAFDAQIRSRFEEAWRLGCAGKLEDWENEPNGALALVILFDQFPRNMFRGSGEAFASDSLAREVAKRAIAQKHDLEVPATLRSFFYLPLMHSEHLADQETCVHLTRERLGKDHFSYPYALSHKEAVERFGRFPARNKALGRANTAEEQEFLNHNPRGF